MKTTLSIISFFVISLIFITTLQNRRKTSTHHPKNIVKKHNPKTTQQPPKTSKHKSKKIFVKQNMTFFGIMRRERLLKKTIFELLSLAKPHFNLAQLPINTEIEVTRSTITKKIVQIDLSLSEDDSLVFRKNNRVWKVKKKKTEWTIQKNAYRSIVTTSLWESLLDHGLSEQVIQQFTKIFSSQIDFDRQTRFGDSWKILIEEKIKNEKFFGWRNIIYAEYNTNKKIYHAIRFPEKAKRADYYTIDGDNLAGLFLKSPVKFGRISSKFQYKRFHPILKIVRPHYGIDYAAPRGTPVFSVGNGLITKMGYSKNSGNYVFIKHNRTYETAYKHLQGFARKLKVRSKVKQGQVIGYVGSTGLATGPHLHFEFRKKNRHIDPLSTSFPRKSHISLSQKTELKRTALLALQQFTLLTQGTKIKR